MAITLWLPLLVAIIAGSSAGLVQRRLPPPLSARLLTWTVVAALVAVGWGLALVAFGYLVQFSWIADLVGWCQGLVPGHDRPSNLVGVASTGLLLFGAARVVGVVRRYRSFTLALSVGAPAIDILPLPHPIAFAVPGRPGHIVVSQSMLDCLDRDEQRVLFAHEQAHLDHRHHRYVRWADVAASTLPLLRPLAANVRFATERWADEVAAASVRDRALVARSITKAALAGASVPAPVLGISGSGVPARVDALLNPERRRPWLTTPAIVGSYLAMLTTLGAVTLQLHHFVAFAAHLCPT